MTSLKVLENGPYLLNGDLTIEYADGHTEKRSGVTALCRCGESNNKPMCDGGHAACGFRDAARGRADGTGASEEDRASA